MVRLTDRLLRLAGEIPKGHITADIGTDHGLLPIFLYQQGIAPQVILSDINSGPLEKARANIAVHAPDTSFDIRLGGGLETLEKGEVDSVVIAGMGGLLMIQILEQDLEKSCSVKRFVLQPRNASDKLRKWLFEKGFNTVNESLVREGKYICEIITALPPQKRKGDAPAASAAPDRECGKSAPCSLMDFEISPLLFEKRDPLLKEFIERKAAAERKIMKAVIEGRGGNDHPSYKEAEKRLAKLQEKWKQVDW